jgi:hypothetical protein
MSEAVCVSFPDINAHLRAIDSINYSICNLTSGCSLRLMNPAGKYIGLENRATTSKIRVLGFIVFAGRNLLWGHALVPLYQPHKYLAVEAMPTVARAQHLSVHLLLRLIVLLRNLLLPSVVQKPLCSRPRLPVLREQIFSSQSNLRLQRDPDLGVSVPIITIFSPFPGQPHLVPAACCTS